MPLNIIGVMDLGIGDLITKFMPKSPLDGGISLTDEKHSYAKTIGRGESRHGRGIEELGRTDRRACRERPGCYW